jgi:putative heme-binding domain-containing protein
MLRLPIVLVALLAVAAGWTAVGAQVNQDHGQYDAAVIEAGRRLYGQQCRACHGNTGDGVPAVDLKVGRFASADNDEAIAKVITGGVPGKGMPGFTFEPREVTSLVAFIRAGFDEASLSIKLGSPQRGRALFEGKGECATCHRVNGKGPRLAPDLSDIGAVRTAASLQRSLLQPTESLLPINRPVRVMMRDGRTLKGRRLNEDTYTVQIIDAQERLLSLNKSDIKQLVVETTASMPSYEGRLTSEEMSDLLGYLASLRGL